MAQQFKHTAADGVLSTDLDERPYEPATPPPTQSRSDGDELRDAKERETRVRVLAVLLALDGLDIEEALKHSETIRSVELDALEEEYQTRVEFLAKRIKELEDSINDCKQGLDGVSKQQDLLRTEHANADLNLHLLRVKKEALLLGIRVKRIENEKKFFAEREKDFEAKSERAEQESDTWRERELDKAKRLHSLLQNVWDIDEAELRRRAGTLEEDKTRIDGHLAEVEKKVKDLRNIGVTRTTAGFMVWVGYSVFAGVGGLVGKLLQGRQNDPKSADSLGNFIRGISSFLGLQSGGQFQWMPLILMIGLTLFVAALVIGVTVLSDYLLNKFHTPWKKSGGGTKGGDRGSRWQDVISALGPGSFRFSVFSRAISRNDYVQLLAAVPYLILAAVIVFIISAVDARSVIGVPSPGGPGALTLDALSTPTTLTSASIGAVFVLLGTSACLLYATKIIETRWNRFVLEPPEGPRVWNFVRINWEFAALMVAMIAGLLVLGFVPFGAVSNYAAWASIGFFMSLASMGFAYGLIYRGIFRDYDVLGRRRQDCIIRIEEHILKPTLGDIFEATEPVQPSRRANKYRMAATYLEGLEIGYELKRMAPERPSDADEFLKSWLDDFGEDEAIASKRSTKRYIKRLRKMIRRLLARHRAPNQQESIPWDADPGSLEEYRLLEEEVQGNTAKLNEINGRIGQLNHEKSVTEARLSTLEAERDWCQQRAASATINHAKKRRDREVESHGYSEEFKSAFVVGKLWYDYLKGGAGR